MANSPTIGPMPACELDLAAERLPGWSYDTDRRALHRHFEFDDFSEAFAFMGRVALASNGANHHPEWFNAYNQLDIWLTTHDAGGVTARDIALALSIDELLDEQSAAGAS